MSLTLREGLLHHGPSNRAVLLRNGITHTLHGDVSRVGGQLAHTQNDKRELRGRCFRMTQNMDNGNNKLLTAMPMMGAAWSSFILVNNECV